MAQTFYSCVEKKLISVQIIGGRHSARTAMLPQKSVAADGDHDAYAKTGDRLARDIAAIPDRQPRA